MRYAVVDPCCLEKGLAAVYSVVAKGLELKNHVFSVAHVWDEAAAQADVVILSDPVNASLPREDSVVLGQRTLTRFQRLEIARDVGCDVGRFWSPKSVEGWKAAFIESGSDELVLKYDWSYGRRGVRLLQRSEFGQFDDHLRLPPFSPDRDVVMEILAKDPSTFKFDMLGAVILGAWVLPTRSIRDPAFYYYSPPAYEYRPPPSLGQILSELGMRLLRFGVGYFSVDLMHTDSSYGYSIVEVNTCSAGRRIPWSKWPQLYADQYVVALEQLQRADLPAYGRLRALIEHAAEVPRPDGVFVCGGNRWGGIGAR